MINESFLLQIGIKALVLLIRLTRQTTIDIGLMKDIVVSEPFHMVGYKEIHFAMLDVELLPKLCAFAPGISCKEIDKFKYEIEKSEIPNYEGKIRTYADNPLFYYLTEKENMIVYIFYKASEYYPNMCRVYCPRPSLIMNYYIFTWMFRLGIYG